MTQEHVEQKLIEIFNEAERNGNRHIRIVARDLHARLDFTGETNHNRYPMCCKAMLDYYNEERDTIIHETPSRQSSTLEIEYELPRK